MKRIITVCLLAIFLLSFSVETLGCGSHVKHDYFTVNIKNIPRPYSADILISKDDSELAFSDFNGKYMLESGIRVDSEIALYNEDNFVSYTAHGMGSSTLFTNEFSGQTYYFSFENKQYLFFKEIKIAVFDSYGNIKHISDEIDVDFLEDDIASYEVTIDYDYDTGEVSVKQSKIKVVIPYIRPAELPSETESSSGTLNLFRDIDAVDTGAFTILVIIAIRIMIALMGISCAELLFSYLLKLEKSSTVVSSILLSNIFRFLSLVAFSFGYLAIMSVVVIELASMFIKFQYFKYRFVESRSTKKRPTLYLVGSSILFLVVLFMMVI